MSLSLGLAGVEAGALQDDVHVELAPGQLSGVGHGVNGDLLAVDDDVILAGFDGAGQSIGALGGVILQQMRQHLGGGQIVDGDDFVALSTEHLTERETADAAKTIDSNSYGHVISSLKISRFTRRA